MFNLQKRVMNTKLMTRRSFLIAYDIMAVCLSCIAPLWIRYEFHYEEIPFYFINSVWHMMPFSVILTLAAFWILRLYHSLWAYAGVTEMQNIVSPIRYLICLVFPLFNLEETELTGLLDFILKNTM